jgi:hypothetical protein
MRMYFTPFALAVALSAADPIPQVTKTNGNNRLELEATVVLDRNQINDLLGEKLPDGIIIVRMKASPKGEDSLKLDPEDFLLLSHKDGQRSAPYLPAQIAGNASLTLKVGAPTYQGLGAQNNGPIIGGIPGTGTRPRQLPGQGGITGTATAQIPGEMSAETSKNKEKNETNPLLEALKAKQFPAKDSVEPVTGLLFFPLDGKHKPKDLSIIYKGAAGRMIIEFAGK